MMKHPILTALFLLANQAANAQGYVDQKAVAPLLETQTSGNAPDAVKWHVYKFPASAKTNKARLAHLNQHLQSLPGELKNNRMAVVELSNRATSKYFSQKNKLLIPDSFVADFRAFSPYPIHWQAADTLPQIFVIDRYTQTFGAYERGKLVRWGLVSTGSDASETPGGRFAFGWKAEQRNSSEAPEGEVWELRWVYNFYPSRGIHVHQYSLPISKNVSHGCVRMTESDAAWNYNWAQKGTPVLVLNNTSYGMAAHWNSDNGQVTSQVFLPPGPMDVPDGIGNDGTVLR